MAQVDIESIEKRLWGAADQLRANSNYASNEYFMPVMGLIFLRHAYSRYLAVKPEIEAGLPKRGGKTRALTKADFSQRSSIFLKPEAQFDYLVSLSDDQDRAGAIVEAMESIEADYETLRGVLPKSEYQQLDPPVLGQLLRTLNPEELKTAKGDVFGRIYEYFLTQFADQKAHDGGEFFTPVSLVSLIANVIEPTAGTVLDPACGSGGMFVQSASLVERRHENPSEKLTFYGMEKNETTIRLAKMNLAVHGLEGDIQKAITYYEDPHELLGKADYVIANPPFNVDEVDSERVKNDPRLPFGLPGVNKQKKVSNGNYLWISYFHSYLKESGRAGFVMSSQASSAGHGEKEVRRKLVESGDVDVMIAIRGNFFYTRSVPCELWFFDRAKPEHQKDQVLMLDARNVYRKVTRKVFDFTPEQLANLTAIVALYREQPERFLGTVANHLDHCAFAAKDCFFDEMLDAEPLPALLEAFDQLHKHCKTLVDSAVESGDEAEIAGEYQVSRSNVQNDIAAFQQFTDDQMKYWNQTDATQIDDLVDHADHVAGEQANAAANLIKALDLHYKLACRVLDAIEAQSDKHEEWNRRDANRARKVADAARKLAVDQLKRVRHFHRSAHWLLQKFPEAKLVDVPGLVKVVNRRDIEKAEWSLTPGRYVGVAPPEEDEEFDFEEALRDVHVELAGLNDEAAELAKTIQTNFEELGV
ncbi:MAG: N-6 DNA methylase [Planctomycetota bacterium]